jgi:hypothetical protein
MCATSNADPVANIDRHRRTAGTIDAAPMVISIDARYEQKIDRTGGPDACHPWTGARNGEGFAMFGVDYKMLAAHRWAYIRYVGPLTKQQSVRFLCDDRGCQNRQHWVAESRADSVRRTRSGSRNGRAKLTEADVTAIRASDEPSARLANRYRVAPETVRHVRAGETWRRPI